MSALDCPETLLAKKMLADLRQPSIRASQVAEMAARSPPAQTLRA
jgi:hypothetical protein